MNNGSPWRLDASLARFRTVKPDAGQLSGELDLRHPQAGAQLCSAPGQQLGKLWRRTNPAGPRSLEEAYVRGADLVAVYAPTADFPFREEFYWRVDDDPRRGLGVAGLTALVSLQTQLLDTSPEVWVESDWSSEDTIPLGGSAVLHRIVGGLASVVETVEPSDVNEGPAVAATPQGVMVRWGLRCPFLEKGVIRRARLGFAVMPREDDKQTAQHWLKQFADFGVELTA